MTTTCAEKLCIPAAITSGADAAEYLRLMTRVFSNKFISLEDIEVQTFSSWDFFKVSVFRWSKCEPGCGTKEYRDKLWESHKESLKGLWKQKQTPNPTWRWANQYKHPVDAVDRSIPGLELYICKGSKP